MALNKRGGRRRSWPPGQDAACAALQPSHQGHSAPALHENGPRRLHIRQVGGACRHGVTPAVVVDRRGGGRASEMVCTHRRSRHRSLASAALALSLCMAWMQGCRAQSAPVLLEPTPGMLQTDDFDHTIQIGEELSLSFAAESQGGITNQLLPGTTNSYDPYVWKLEGDFFPRIQVDEDPGMPNGARVMPPRFDMMDMEVETFLNPANNLTTNNPRFKYALTWSWIPTCAQASSYKMHMSILVFAPPSFPPPPFLSLSLPSCPAPPPYSLSHSLTLFLLMKRASCWVACCNSGWASFNSSVRARRSCQLRREAAAALKACVPCSASFLTVFLLEC